MKGRRNWTKRTVRPGRIVRVEHAVKARRTARAGCTAKVRHLARMKLWKERVRVQHSRMRNRAIHAVPSCPLRVMSSSGEKLL